MIVDASVVIDAVADPGARGTAARRALATVPAGETLHAPGHFAFEVMSGLQAAANRPQHPLRASDISQALEEAASFGIAFTVITWPDVNRAWELAKQSLRYADAIYVAVAERTGTGLMTADGRIERSGASIRCQIVTVRPEGAEGVGQ